MHEMWEAEHRKIGSRVPQHAFERMKDEVRKCIGLQRMSTQATTSPS